MNNEKQYMLFINNRSNAAVLPFPPKLDLPETKEIRDVKYVRTNRKKTFPDYKAVIYVEQNSTININDFADEELVTPEELAPLMTELTAKTHADDIEAMRSSEIDLSKMPLTRVYGRSDDLIEFDGAYNGEVGAYRAGEDGKGVLLIISDGTLLEVKYGKGDLGIWSITVIKKGASYAGFEPCDDEDADIYSDVVSLRGEVKYAYASTDWDKVE